MLQFLQAHHTNQKYGNIAVAVLSKLAVKGPDKIYRLKWGLCEAVHVERQPIFEAEEDGKFKVNYDLLHNAKQTRPRYHRGRKIFYFMSVDDQIMAPTKELAMEYANMLFGT